MSSCKVLVVLSSIRSSLCVCQSSRRVFNRVGQRSFISTCVSSGLGGFSRVNVCPIKSRFVYLSWCEFRRDEGAQTRWRVLSRDGLSSVECSLIQWNSCCLSRGGVRSSWRAFSETDVRSVELRVSFKLERFSIGS
jgi:hypothetical protein